MSEFGNGAPRAASEILNTPYEVLAELSADISSGQESLRQYIQVMRRSSPGLTKQAGAWVGVIRGSIPSHGLTVALRAEGVFTAGNAMMYELLRRVAERTGLPVPDSEFISDSLVDDDIYSYEPQWLIELSFRGEKLFRNHPDFFEAALVMFARNNGGHDPKDVKELLFAAPDPADVFSFDLVHYLNGAAEVVLPVERQAQVAALGQ